MTDNLHLEPFFEPFTLKGLRLPNRFVMPAMQRQWCIEGRPTARLTEYYRRRIEGGVGLLITESCAVDHPSATQHPAYARMNEVTVEAWRDCVRTATAAGGSMLMQLWHEGAIRAEGGNGPYAAHPTLSPSGLSRPGKRNGRPASSEDLVDIRRAFVRSARLAQHAGFRGVELHAAHGFLLDQFLWAQTNLRTDGYGGTNILDRVRFPAEIVSAVREATGPDFIISLRFSQWKEADYGAKVAQTPEELALLLGRLRSAGVDIFHASARRFWTPEWSQSSLGIAGWAKASTDAPVIAVGSVGLDIDVMDNFFGQEARSTGAAGLEELVRRFANREFDLVSVGRSLIGDPDWIRKVRQGRFDAITMFTKKDLLGDLELTDFNPDAEH